MALADEIQKQFKDKQLKERESLSTKAKKYWQEWPENFEKNQRAMDKTMAGLYKTDIMGRPNPNYYPEAMQEFTQNYLPNFMGATAIFHGTSKEAAKQIEKAGFDVAKSADGSIWFTTNPNIGEVAATGKGAVVKRLIDEGKVKLATPEQADKYFTDQLIGEGYQGVKYPGYGPNEATHYQIYEPGVLEKGYKDEGQFRRVGKLPTGNEEAWIQAPTGQETIQRSFENRKLGQPQGGGQGYGSQQNKAIEVAKGHNPDFDIQKIKDMPESSIQKQHPIAKAYEVLSQENVDPKLKEAIFADYQQKHPDLIKQNNIQNYDDLVNKSYSALRGEVDHQFDDLVNKGVKFSFHQGDANYSNSKEMLEDALGNNHMYVFRGGEEHPFLNDFDPFYGLNTNEKFRAVHDYIGHGTTSSTFGRKGEELAYGAHKQTLSPLAQIAAASETRGQNSFVNYSGINADLEHEMALLRVEKNQAERMGQSTEDYDRRLRELGGQWEYAKQTGLALPPDMLELNYKGKVPDYLKEHIEPKSGQDITGFHWSNAPNLAESDVKKYGFGIKGQEAERLRSPGAVKERTYFYTDPSIREPGLGKNQYQATLQNSYDIVNDPDNLVKMADTFNRDKFNILDEAGKANDYERMIKEAGYSGYFNPNSNAAVSFKNQPLKVVDTDLK